MEIFSKKPILRLYKIFQPQPNFIADASWDHLIVLDAYRFDVFEKLNNIPGKLSKIISPGNSTPEWLLKNFSERKMKDVVYISANPFATYFYLHKTLGYIPFYKIMEVWRDGWSEELNTVHPSAVNEATLDSLVSHPLKRHLIHYIQPHYPFTGDVSIRGGGWKYTREKHLGTRSEELEREPTVWEMLRKGKIDVNMVWRAYISNFQLILSYITKLLQNLSGKVCITSDHGDVFGKFGFYEHPRRNPLKELIEVPWLDVQIKKA